MNTGTIDFKTVYKKVRSMPPSIRQKTLSGQDGEHWLSLLTPTQFAMLFPDYFKKPLPDVGLTTAASGGVIMGGRSPTMSSGSATPWSGPVSSGGRTSSGGGGGGSGRPSTATPAPPDPNAELGKKLKDAGLVLPEPERPKSGSLGESRKAAAGTMSPDQKKHMMALAIAEVGDNPDAQQALMETIYNRYQAEKKASMADTMKKDYYQPLRDSDPNGQRRYRNALKNLENPEFLAKMEAIHQKVVEGSNLSNYATHNASAGVYDDAARGGYDSIPSTVRKEHGEGWYNKQWDKKWIEATKKADAEAATKIGSTTGSTAETGLTPGPAPAKETEPQLPRPEGMNTELSRYFDSLNPAQQQALIQQFDKLGGLEKVNEMAKSVTKNASGIPNIVPPGESPKKLIPGQLNYLSNERNARIDGVNPKLLAINDEAARRFMEQNPGYRVIVNGTVEDGKAVGGPGSGVRVGRNLGNHGDGGALDITIIDPNGKALENFQSGEYAGMYQQFQNFNKLAQEKYFPEIPIRTGLYFGGQYALDMMHSDTKVWKGYGTQGGWETGFSEDAMRRWNIDPKTNMGMKTFRELYGYDKTATPIGSETGSTKETPLTPGQDVTPTVPLKDRGITTYGDHTPKSEEPAGAAPNSSNPRSPGYVPPAATPTPSPSPSGEVPKGVSPEQKMDEIEVPQPQSAAPQPKAPVQTSTTSHDIAPHSPSAQRAYAQANFEPKHYQGGAASVSKNV
jgi:hypothetical protein